MRCLLRPSPITIKKMPKAKTVATAICSVVMGSLTSGPPANRLEQHEVERQDVVRVHQQYLMSSVDALTP